VVDVSEIDRSPAVLSASLSVFAGMVAVVALALGSPTALAVAVPGLLVVGLALLVGSRRALGGGETLLVGAVLLAGVQGAPAESLLVATLATLLSWDVGDNAVEVGEQLGRGADTRRAELVHAAASTAVGVVGAGVAYGAYLGATGGQPVTALVFLLIGAVALVSALR
jgi:hypothetical protein